MTRRCLVLQPIHGVGLELLRQRGIDAIAPAPGHGALLSLAASVDALITRNATIDRPMMEAGQRLAAIGCHGSGHNSIALAAASACGIPVVNTPGANAHSVAEHAIALMLAVARRIPQADAAGRARDLRFKFENDFMQLRGRTLGLAGWGHTARATAEIAAAGLGMRVLAWRRGHADAAPRSDVVFTEDLAVLLAEAHVLSLHLPLTPQTRHIIGRGALAAMKRGAILINTGRGGLIDEDALLAALQSKQLFGAGLDVLAHEEGGETHENLLASPQVVITPHVAGTTETALQATAIAICDQVADILEGRRPAHLVNPDVWSRRRLPVPVAPIA
ncbi:NAD(P)-dependent oxidoreductase [Methylocapsa sp. S129]|uniref:NAD(P)-dependent oxidoreductase n=1 Tax=Methylocapsa sp. S129 TaxID=1641869 RepID=UPI00131C4547|nr:NAD(P)-dependent oxidoreductase [Methylocapsa sp. S129]